MRISSRRRALIIATLSVSLLSATGLASETTAIEPANGDFRQRWERTDKPVADLMASRTWMWGPEAFTGSVTEPYAESPNGYRQVQYFDKARMEITHPNSHAPNPWYVTTGLLAWELITGQAQFGDTMFETWYPAEINVAGDLDDPHAPTYASFTNLLDLSAPDATKTVTEVIHRDGSITEDDHYAQHDVSTGMFVKATGHWIADPFWEFMGSQGLIYQDGMFRTDTLFVDRFYATGYPITEPYWTTVLLNGEPTDVLVQAFERRVLTYTPSNPAGWKVESGNIGRHYYEWYYGPHPER